MKLILIFLIGLLFFRSCEQEKQTKILEPVVDYEISINQQFQIELKSNPSTGYLWSWTNKQNVSAVDTNGHIFISDNPELVGSGGKEIWKFIGIKSGIDTLEFKYFRPWEADNVVEIKKIVVRVR